MKIFLILLLLLLPLTSNAQKYTAKVNTLALMTGTLDLGLDRAINDKWSVGASVQYNPLINHSAALTLNSKYWLNETNTGYFVGAQLPFGAYNMYRKKGKFIGLGFSFGKSWVINPKWNFLLEGGIGVFHVSDKYVIEDICIRHRNRLLLAPSKLEVSFIYII